MTALTMNDISFTKGTINNGSSPSAIKLDEFLQRTIVHYEEPTILQKNNRYVSALYSFFNELNYDNWDGYGASALSKPALYECEKFLKLLPSDITFPDLVPEPNGGIGFQWRLTKDWVFILSFKGTGIISYASIFGKNNKSLGKHSFNETIPKIIFENIKRINL